MYIVHECMLIGTIVDMYLRRLSWTWAPAKHFGITFIIYKRQKMYLHESQSQWLNVLLWMDLYLFKIDPLFRMNQINSLVFAL